MLPIFQFEGNVQGNSHQMGHIWINQPSPSMISSEGKSDKQSTVIRASTPSKYLKRTGLIPNGPAIKIHSRYKTGILSSASSTMITSPSSPPFDSNITCRSPTAHPDPPSLLSLTESNVARFIQQLQLSDLLHPGTHSFHSTPQSPIEISYFSDGSSLYASSDFESRDSPSPHNDPH